MVPPGVKSVCETDDITLNSIKNTLNRLFTTFQMRVAVEGKILKSK